MEVVTMTSLSALLVAACCLLLVLMAVLRRARFVAKLKGVPGPRALPVVGNALDFTGTQQDFFLYMKKCTDAYGPMFRLWVGPRPFICVHSAEGIQPILNSSVHIDKSPDYRFVEPWIGTGLVTSSGDKWRSRRKLLTPSFHSRVLDEFLEPLFREAHFLAEKLTTHCGGAPFDIVPYAKLAALDIICDTALGKHIGAQRNSSNAYVVAVDKITALIQRRFITPWLKPEPLFQLSDLSRVQKQCLDVIHGFTGRVFAARKQEKLRQWRREQIEIQQQLDFQQKQDGQQISPDANKAQSIPEADKPRRRLALLDLLFDMVHQGASLSDDDIREEVDTITFAGHDTTAAGFSWCLYVLGQHPDVQDRILDEWREVRSSSGQGEGGELSVRDLGRLDFMERCIKEVLRLYPVVPLIARDIRSPATVLGHEIPAGCTLLINTYLLHRDERYFADPERFNPDRFLPGSDDQRHPFAYVPFSAGSRNCIGQRFAMLELKVLLGTFLERFHVRSEDPPSALELLPELVLNNKGGIKLTITPRKN